MRYAEHPAPHALDHLVRFLWTLDSDTTGDLPHRLTAETCPNIVLIHRGAFTEADGSPTPSMHLAGALTRPADMIGHGPFSIVGAYLWPWAVGPLFGRTPAACMDRFIPVEHLTQADPKDLMHRCAATPGERTAALGAWLEGIPQQHGEDDLTMDHIVRRILLETEHRPITEHMDASGMARRPFERRFKARTGFSPALFQRIVRFQRCYRMLERGEVANLTELAMVRGYADQSHFIRDFKRFSGLNPRSYFVKAPARVDNFLQLPGG